MLCGLLAGQASGSDPAQRDLQRHQLHREQQQHELQLRMLQQQRDAQRFGGQAARELEIDRMIAQEIDNNLAIVKAAGLKFN